MTLKYIILTVIHENGTATGYDIAKEFQDKWQYIWNSSHQQVYRELGKLLDSGALSCRSVKQSARPDKKVYRVTKQGREELKAWQLSPFEPGRANDELLIRLAGWQIAGPKALQFIMQRQREIHRNQLAYYRKVESEFVKKKNLRASDKMLLLPLRKGILIEEAWQQWANEVDQALNAMEQSADHRRKGSVKKS